MSLPSFSVRRGVTVTMVYLMIVGFGLFSLARLQLDLYPDLESPMVLVLTTYTGASPDDMETLISRPIEAAAVSVQGVEKIRSTSKQGSSMVMVEFDWGKDMEQAETEVRRALDMVKGMLPTDANDPMVFALDPSMQPIVMMMVSGPYPLDELRRIAEEEIKPRLERLDGIASAEAAGGLEREIQVRLNREKLEAFNLDINQIIGAIYQENVQEPGGYIEQGVLEFSIQPVGRYQSVEEIGEILIGMHTTPKGPKPIILRDVAEVVDSFSESQRILEVDGDPAVWMMVRKQSGSNTVNAAEAVIAALPLITQEIGAELDFRILFNQAEFINDSMSNLSTTGLFAVIISFLVLLVFLRNLRSSLIVASAIPISVVATFSVMDQANMTLNVISMAGLALAIGMLVDNAIVVLENIFRLREEGLDMRDAAMQGAKEVSMAVTASMLTTISVFVPILFVPGIAGALFTDMAITICFALTISLLVALTFIPLAASRLLGGKKGEKLMGRLQKRKEKVNYAREAYGRVLDWTLRRRWVVALGVVAVLTGTGILWTLMPTEFMAENDQSQINLSVETEISNNIDEARRVVDEVMAVVEEVIRPEERRLIGLDMGIGEGFASIFSKGAHAGTIRIRLVKVRERTRSQQEIQEALRTALRDVPGVKANIAGGGALFGSGADLDIEIRGHNLDVSRMLGKDLQDRLELMPEISEVTFSMEEQKPQVEIRYDRPKIAQLGLSTAAIGRAASTYFRGRIAGRYSEDGDEYDIVVRYDKDYRTEIEDLRRMPIRTMTGNTLQLATVAEVYESLGPSSITRQNQERITTLSVILKKNFVDENGVNKVKDLGTTLKKIDDMLKGYAWPQGFSYTIGGSAEDFQDSFRYLGLALLVSIFLVYMVMASQFESFRQPFIIIFSVPLAGIGVVLVFSLTGAAMDVSAMIGGIMLVGIVVNNGIVMVDAANQLRQEGLDRIAAIAQACRLRLRPVLLTSTTTILSMVPLALEIGEGAENWSGMAKAVIGGLISATFLTLFVVPTMYTFFAPKKVKDLKA